MFLRFNNFFFNLINYYNSYFIIKSRVKNHISILLTNQFYDGLVDKKSWDFENESLLEYSKKVFFFNIIIINLVYISSFLNY